MEQKQSLFKKIDMLIFKQVDGLISQSFWHQIADRFRILPEAQQKYLNHILSLLIIALPLGIVAILFVVNSSVSNELQMQKEISELIQNISDKHIEFSSLEKVKLSKTTILNQSDATNMLSKALERTGVNTSKIKLKNYDNSISSSGVSISNISFGFENFSFHDFSNSVSTLITKEKVIFTSLKLLKNEKTNSLNGAMNLTHYSKE